MDNIERQIHAHKMKMELQRQKAQLEFDNEIRELELEERRIELENMRKWQGHDKHKKDDGIGGLFFLIAIIVSILLAIWVFKDIRQNNSGSGVWIVIVLLTGLLGALVYAVVRLADIRRNQP